MRAGSLAVMLALSACATVERPVAINAPAPAPLAAHREWEGDVLALAFSGGGARAAAFSFGALEGLSDLNASDGRPLLDHVRLVTSVSGGSITAAYFAQHGASGLGSFRAAYLDKDWQTQLHTSPYSPLNWARASRGGLNDQPRFADWLDAEVFGHARMNAAWEANGVQLWLNSTDLYNGTTFAFTPLYFDGVCADLGSVRLADAVAASMAFPIVFRPVLLAAQPERCGPLPAWAQTSADDHEVSALERRTAQAFQAYRDPARQPFLHLIDGGVLDNLGLTSLALARETAGTPIGPLSEREAARVTSLTFLVVNAEQIRTSTWQQTSRGPSGAETVDALYGIAIEGPNRSAYDQFRLLLADWQRDVRAWRCGLSDAEVVRLRGSLAGWDCNDISFHADMLSFADFGEAQRRQLAQIPTRVTLPRESVDMLIAAGREGVARNAAVQRLRR